MEARDFSREFFTEPFGALDAQTRIKLQSGHLDAWEQEKNYKEVAKLVNLLHENCFNLG